MQFTSQKEPPLVTIVLKFPAETTTGQMHRNRRFLAHKKDSVLLCRREEYPFVHKKHEVFLSGPVAQNGIVVPLVQMGKLSHSACSSSHFVRDFAHLVCKASLGAVPLTMLFPTKVFSLERHQ